MHIIKIPNKT